MLNFVFTISAYFSYVDGHTQRVYSLGVAQTYEQYLHKLKEAASKQGYKLATKRHTFTIPAPLLKEFLTRIKAEHLKARHAIGEAIYNWIELQRRG